MKQQHSLYRRIIWHPLFVAIPLALITYTSYHKGFNSLRVVGLAVVGLWFILSTYNLASKHKILDWMYPVEED